MSLQACNYAASSKTPFVSQPSMALFLPWESRAFTVCSTGMSTLQAVRGDMEGSAAETSWKSELIEIPLS